MGYTHTSLMEQNLALLRVSVDRAYICSGNPQTYAQVLTNALAYVGINQFSFNDPDAGVVDGRKMTLRSLTMTADTQGDGSHLALVNTSTGVLWLSFSRTFTKEINPGETISIPDIDIEEGDFTVII